MSRTLLLNTKQVELMCNDFTLFELWLSTQNYDILIIETNEIFLKNKVIQLPNKLVIDNLYIENSPLEYLPDDIHITHSLYATDSNLKIIPKELWLRRLFANNTSIIEIPNSLMVSEILSIANTKISKLPTKLKLECLDISNTLISEIPKSCIITQELRINNTLITQLPNNLNLSILDIRNTNINSLPKNISILDVFYSNGQFNIDYLSKRLPNTKHIYP